MYTSAYTQDFLTKIYAYTYFLTICIDVAHRRLEVWSSVVTHLD
jgi:hypothetical protein